MAHTSEVDKDLFQAFAVLAVLTTASRRLSFNNYYYDVTAHHAILIGYIIIVAPDYFFRARAS